MTTDSVRHQDTKRDEMEQKKTLQLNLCNDN